MLPGLVACGDDDASADSGSVTVSGEPGTAPEVTYEGTVERSSTQVEVLHEGDGPVVGPDDTAFVHLYIGNGYTGEEAYSTWADERPTLLAVDGTLPALQEALVDHTVGSRVQVVAPPEDAYPNGNPDLYIGNADTVVFVVDILSSVLDGPQGEATETPSGFPEVVEKDGTVSSLDFSGAGKPSDELEVVTLVEGDGPAIEKGTWLAMRYLGQVHGKKKPFDENYSADEITPFQIGVGQLIEGWDKGLVGVRQGSRVMLSVPPQQGYGKKGNKSAGITGTDTLVFVVDVLGVA